jgi:hypothetical protein
LLEINCQNVKYGSKEESLKIIAVIIFPLLIIFYYIFSYFKASSNQVYFLISREIAPTVPFDASLSTKSKFEKSPISAAPSVWQEFTLALNKVKIMNNKNLSSKIKIILNKERNEPLGVNISGGIRGFDGESTPIFVSAIEQKSCIDKSKHIKVRTFVMLID